MFRLKLPQTRVDAASGQELIVRSPLHEAALGQNQDLIRVGDRESVFTPAITQHLCDLAKTAAEQKPRRFKFQRLLMDGGICEATAFLQAGYSAGGLCVTLKNYHNGGPTDKIASENIHLEDWFSLVELITRIAKSPPR
jgi:endoglucanase